MRYRAVCTDCMSGNTFTITSTTLPQLARGMDAFNMLADAPVTPNAQPTGVPFEAMEPGQRRTITSSEIHAALDAYNDCPERSRRIVERADVTWRCWMWFLNRHADCPHGIQLGRGIEEGSLVLYLGGLYITRRCLCMPCLTGRAGQRYFRLVDPWGVLGPVTHVASVALTTSNATG